MTDEAKARCSICKRPLDSPSDPTSLDGVRTPCNHNPRPENEVRAMSDGTTLLWIVSLIWVGWPLHQIAARLAWFIKELEKRK